MMETALDTPLGRLCVRCEGDAVVGIHFEDQRGRPEPAPAGRSALLDEAKRQLAEYFAGERRSFALPLRPKGTAFQQRVWRVLAEVPFGATASYGELARRAGEGSARAVGAANARNPFTIVWPCHRVVGADGTLTGYAGGLDRKAWLLDFERALTPAGARRSG